MSPKEPDRARRSVARKPPGFAPNFFDRADPSPDAVFYRPPRLLTHIDDAAVDAVGALYEELRIDAGAPEPTAVLDLMSSWVSHLRTAPAKGLTVLGMNRAELDANPMATERVVQDLNQDPVLPFRDAGFDAALCCVSIDYLVHPVEVLTETARVLRPGAPVVVTFSNRCFPTKAVRGWLDSDDDGRAAIVVEYLRQTGGFTDAQVLLRTPRKGPGGGPYRGDPLYAVVARRSGT